MLVLLTLFLLACSQENSIGSDDSLTDEDVVDSCNYTAPQLSEPQNPQKVNITAISKYEGNTSCIDLPEPQNGVLELDEGCYKGCLEVSGSLKITGKGSDKTLIFCEEISAEAAFSGVDAHLEISGVSINSVSKGIDLDGVSSLSLTGCAVYNCVKGGISGCIEGEDCSSQINISGCRISDVKEDPENSIGYGITSGSGKVQIKDSSFENLYSFAGAVWDGGELSIENSVIKNILGNSTNFQGVAVYAESSDVTMKKVRIENVGTSFIFLETESGKQSKAVLEDIFLKGFLENESEQGGIVLDGNMEVNLTRVSVKESRGSGIFGNGVKIDAQDVLIEDVSSDPTTENGFGIVLFETEAQFERLSVSGAEKAGVLVDGLSEVFLKDLEITYTKADPVNGEFGIGAAVQDGALLTMENGTLSGNREAGVMAVGAEVILNNIEVKDTLPRKCVANGGCTFADGVPFGHGVSLYSDSKLSFQNVFISGNSNGFNLESSVAERLGGTAFFLDNSSAVNAWNINDLSNLEEAFDGVTFCNNKSIFTTDVQPVRESF